MFNFLYHYSFTIYRPSITSINPGYTNEEIPNRVNNLSTLPTDPRLLNTTNNALSNEIKQTMAKAYSYDLATATTNSTLQQPHKRFEAQTSVPTGREHGNIPPAPNYRCFNCKAVGQHYKSYCPKLLADKNKTDGSCNDTNTTPIATNASFQQFDSRRHAFDKRAAQEVMGTTNLNNNTLNNTTLLSSIPIPEHLQCFLCKTILKQAVLLPCCGMSACDSCARQALLERNSLCPNNKCGKRTKPDQLIPTIQQRQAVDAFLKFQTEELVRLQNIQNQLPTTTLPSAEEPVPIAPVIAPVVAKPAVPMDPRKAALYQQQQEEAAEAAAAAALAAQQQQNQLAQQQQQNSSLVDTNTGGSGTTNTGNTTSSNKVSSSFTAPTSASLYGDIDLELVPEEEPIMNNTQDNNTNMNTGSIHPPPSSSTTETSNDTNKDNTNPAATRPPPVQGWGLRDQGHYGGMPPPGPYGMPPPPGPYGYPGYGGPPPPGYFGPPYGRPPPPGFFGPRGPPPPFFGGPRGPPPGPNWGPPPRGPPNFHGPPPPHPNWGPPPHNHETKEDNINNNNDNKAINNNSNRSGSHDRDYRGNSKDRSSSSTHHHKSYNNSNNTNASRSRSRSRSPSRNKQHNSSRTDRYNNNQDSSRSSRGGNNNYRDNNYHSSRGGRR